VSEDRTLVRQRDRWQRSDRDDCPPPRDAAAAAPGRIGCVAMPYFIVFELLGPTIECFARRFGTRPGPPRPFALALRRPADLLAPPESVT
jgi:hypothetical protein